MAEVLCVGHAVQDFVFSVDAIPTTPQKHRARGLASVGGGPAATAAVTVARLGGRARLAARLGDDPVGDLILAELAGYGVDTAFVRRFAGHASSLSAVLVDKRGERMIVNYLDHALPSRPEWLPPIPEGTGAVLVDARWPEGALAALDAARAAGLPAVLDADTPLAGRDDLVGAASHVAFSAEGLAEYSGRDEPEAALAEVAENNPAWCCVTLGAEGTLIAARGGMERLSGHRVTAVDTLGAGDVWHGAFSLALAERRSERAAVRFANAAAAVKVSRPGGRAGTPARGEVERMMSAHTISGPPR